MRPTGHCIYALQKLAPEWESAAKTLEGKEPDIVLANVDCTAEENKPLAEKYDVKGFPTIKARHRTPLPPSQPPARPSLLCLGPAGGCPP